MNGAIISVNPVPPFPEKIQLNNEPCDTLIPGEYIPVANAPTFLRISLTQAKTNAIFRHLSFAGAPGNFRALHEQHVFRRTIVPCEDPSLHLIWFNDTIYMKPLPPCLMNYEFLKAFVCPSEELFSLACGLLYSYIHLIRYESDFRIASEQGLLRGTNLTWEKWQRFRLSVKSFLDANRSAIDKRYRYGELRLDRLNVIHFLKFGEFKGYFNTFTCYSPFLSRYFSAAFLIFAFASVSLNAMQVAIQQSSPTVPSSFVNTCYRFSIAILIGVVLITLFLTALVVPIVVFDLTSGLISNKELARELKRSQA
jgi:hypothetical protein